MYFSSALVAASALALVNGAAFTMPPTFFQGIKAGTALNLTWSLTGSGPVAIYLRNGIATNLKPVAAAPALSGISGTSTSYIIPVTLPDDTYAFEIDETGEAPNYSVQFAVTGGAASTSAGSTSTVTGSSTSTVSGTSSSTSSTATAAGNSTTSASKTGSTTSASKTGTSTSSSSTSSPSSLNSAADVASPLAFVFFAVTAVFFLQ